MIEGRLEISSFTGQDGQPRKKAEIVAFTAGVTKLASKGGGPGSGGGPAAPGPRRRTRPRSISRRRPRTARRSTTSTSAPG
jgi:single-stranded DNA-binding protein